MSVLQGEVRLPEIEQTPEHPMERFFKPLRRRRRQHYASRPETAKPKRKAVQTIVHNEPVFLPIWLRYYSRYFAPEDIYVLDNETSDGSTSGDGFVRIPVERGSVDHRWMAAVLADHQHELLDVYDAVLTTDVDEIVAPAPDWGPLDAYVDRLDEEFVNCMGYEILHMRDREPPFQPEQPVLSQRGFWFANDAYDKPALTMEPMNWEPGLHARSDGRFNFDPDLRLIHLHRMDYEICRDRHRLRRSRDWNADDVERGWAEHNRFVEDGEFAQWFYGQTGLDGLGIELKVSRIPPSYRGLF